VLPHRFPFRLIDCRVGEWAIAGISVNSAWVRGREGLPNALLIEILAQAAILLDPEGSEEQGGLLAGIDQASFAALPVAAGERLSVRVNRAGSFGRLAKVTGSLERQDGARLCEASLLLARDGS
jgi:3-hydroxymyristoyl/3-hydroxydecanoyl-(acyl carrier protein) dehydratase